MLSSIRQPIAKSPKISFSPSGHRSPRPQGNWSPMEWNSLPRICRAPSELRPRLPWRVEPAQSPAGPGSDCLWPEGTRWSWLLGLHSRPNLMLREALPGDVAFAERHSIFAKVELALKVEAWERADNDSA